ncbi:hypothetical protein [Massilia sp. YIM B04103]|uniref:hypothetical protein n=1 Tax=Massilia sp. YIM B04103 TaxID=2963106 RepID=UPI00210A69B5|nr:hypothetical protein [Massilia sp. YIM B04103]
MYKKLALFLFAAAASLSASISTARPPDCAVYCGSGYRYCMSHGGDAVQCRASYEQCLRHCAGDD